MIPTYNITIIGAGQIGSRHLQALKNVNLLLNIVVVDPSQQSLTTAKQRYEEMPKGKYLSVGPPAGRAGRQVSHEVKYLQEINAGQNIDLAIVATTSDVRAKAIKDILKKNQVRYFILEKILFDKKGDYYEIENIFSKLKIKAWINCARRIWPIYKKIKKELAGNPISLKASMGKWALACNAVHFVDLVAHLTGDAVFSIDASCLDKKLLPSKKKGFLEVSGTLCADFENGSNCELTSYSAGNAPFLMEIFNKDMRYVIREPENKAWVSSAKNDWQWGEISFKTLLVSETTTVVVENILANGNCSLAPYKESIKMHISLLEPLRHFLNKNSRKKYEDYPFT